MHGNLQLTRSPAACPSTTEVTIQSQSDADAFSDCTTFEGSIKIDASASGNIGLNAITDIHGNLSCVESSSLQSLAAPQLKRIGGTLHLEQLTMFGSLEMPNLLNVQGIMLVGLPSLQDFSLSIGLETINDLQIVNTQITSISGVKAPRVDSVEITHNFNLTSITLNSIININSALTIDNNDDGVDLLLSNLAEVGNLSVSDVSSLSLPSLQNVTTSMYISSSSALEIRATALSLVEGDLVVEDCSSLSKISFPALQTVGGALRVSNNTELTAIAFDDLQSIGGVVDVTGSFNK